ncbi:MAG TPA: recombinase family protein [Actinophytocola sp.]|uniref:recombinase family protein n=1 Tax=Actinophytocola sp. TaxID=1872138 RepID=UPI002DBCA6AA|nr:recombinase family protein [Actinophytocola sp.]HEU5469405.1 recombinase family protein [Actinophytocola sp.]
MGMAVLSGVEFVAAVEDRLRDRRSSSPGASREGLRFAFYGRMSTCEFQDVGTSWAWQREVAEELVEGFGAIVVDFFDEGRSRRWAWPDRPAAAALLADARRPDRRFDAVVVGEYERAFHVDQFQQVAAELTEVGVQVWLPEAGGPVDLGSPVHQALMVLLGAQAQREVARARARVLAAMRAQARVQGRFLGGRPPFGYRLADNGPHPNAEHARWGRRLHGLEPDPATAPWVRWLFAQRADGRSVASLVRELNDRGVPCPSRADASRNPHRTGQRWIVRTVAMILQNPRYTGRQVWNRHSTQGHGGTGRPGGRGSGAVRRNPAADWEVSEHLAHAPLVDDAAFLTVQRMRTGRPSQDGEVRQFYLAGLTVCGVCGRRMDAHWVHGRPGYRCRHGYTSATRRPADAPRNVYHREDQLLDALPGLLADTLGEDADFSPHDPVGVLRERDLQIVCTHHDRQLRAATPYGARSAPSSTGPRAQTLRLEFHHGDGFTADQHAGAAIITPRDTRCARPRAGALQTAVG